MSKPTNLNRFRKNRARADQQARADQNAVRFGRTKLQKQLEKTRLLQADRNLDAHRKEE